MSRCLAPIFTMTTTPPEKNPWKKPLIKELMAALTPNELNEILTFFKARQAIKRDMLKGKAKSFVIVAEKS
jgi:hypothetical protein